MEVETFHSHWRAPYAYFGFKVTHADMHRDIIIHHCFEILSGVEDANREFQNSIKQEKKSGTALRWYQTKQYSMSPTFWLYQLTHDYSGYTWCVNDSRMVLRIPKQQEGILGRVTVFKLTILPRRLPFCCWPVCEIIHYRISSSGTEGESAWRFSRDLWDKPNIWGIPMHSYVFDYLLLFVTGFTAKEKRK